MPNNSPRRGRPRKRNQRRPVHRIRRAERLSLESLENRLPLAGDIGATCGIPAEFAAAEGEGEPFVAGIQLQTTDMNGTPIDRAVIGQEFLLQVYVQDFRMDPEGVFAAYTDIIYPDNLAELSGEIELNPEFGNGGSGDVDEPGLIDEVGAFRGLATSNLSSELLLTVPLIAMAPGELVFESDPADDLPSHHVLVYGVDVVVPPGEINFGSTTLSVEPFRAVISEPAPSVSDFTPKFVWNDVATAVRYDLWLDNATTGASQVIRRSDITTNSFTPGTPLPVANYQAWVRPINEAEERGAWSPVHNFRVMNDVPVPGRPTLIGPPKATEDTTPTFAWNKVEHAATYDLWVDNQTTGEGQVIRMPNLNSNTFTPTTPLPFGLYRFWVQARNSENEVGSWSSPREFRIVESVPAQVFSVAPRSTISEFSPTFEWEPVDGAVRYDLWVDNVTTNTEQFIRQENLTTTSYDHPTPFAHGDYVFWVRAVGPNDVEGPWSVPVEFGVVDDVPVPERPIMTGPAPVVTNLQPTIRWRAVEHAARYDIWVDNTTTNESQVIRNQNVPTNSFRPDFPLAEASYRVWVQPINNENERGPWSSPRNFTVSTNVPDVPVVTGPAKTTTDTTPTITWTTSPQAVLYDLWVRNQSTGEDQVIREQTLASTSFTPSTPLSTGTYRVWVSAISAQGVASAYSEPRDFTIVAGGEAEGEATSFAQQTAPPDDTLELPDRFDAALDVIAAETHRAWTYRATRY